MPLREASRRPIDPICRNETLAKPSPVSHLLSVLALALTCTGAAVAAVPSDTLMSSATRGFASVGDFKLLQEHWNQTQMGKLVKDEAMRPFIEDLKHQLERKLS